MERRKFIKKGLTASSIFIVPRHVLGGVGYIPPSDQLNIAGIGVGGKGRSDLENAWGKGQARVAALCDVDLQGDHGVKQSIKRFPEAKFYQDFRALLDQEKDLDAVTISTPDHTHGVIASHAMQSGKHVYVQKPLTHNIKEARWLQNLARKEQRVTQMGNQGASNPEQLKVQKWVNDKEIGLISEVYVWTNRPVWPQGGKKPEANSSLKPGSLDWDLWLGPAPETDYVPNMHPFNWRGWWDYGTGALGDMGCHIIDIPFKALALHYPTDVECSVGTIYEKMWTANYFPEGCPPSATVTLHFDPTPKNNKRIKMVWTDGGIRPSHPDLLPPDVEIESNGIIMVGEKGVITSGVYGNNPKLYKPGEPVQEGEELAKIDLPEFGHQHQWIQACKAGFNSKEHKALTSSFDYSVPLTETVLMGNIAIRSYLLRKGTGQNASFIGRKKLLWDGAKMNITNLEEANQFVGRDYREGWSL